MLQPDLALNFPVSIVHILIDENYNIIIIQS